MMSSPSVFFADTGIPVDKKKTTPGKLPENPLMLRPPPSFSTETAVVPHASVNDSSFSGLRQRRPLEPKTTNAVASPFLPPKSSLSLQTGSLLDKPRSQVSPSELILTLDKPNNYYWITPLSPIAGIMFYIFAFSSLLYPVRLKRVYFRKTKDAG